MAGGSYPSEVSWTLMCSGALIGSGGAPYSGTLSAPPGECTLDMNDSYGDGWNGDQWEGAGNTFTLDSGSSGSATFTLAPLPPPPPLPPPAPPAGSPRYVACGRTGRCDESDRWAALSEKHEVRCCSDSRIDGWKKKDGCSVWSESDDDEMGGKCHHNKNFAQASTICEDAGARLCTRAELQGNCARGSGCGHDRDLIWSGTESEAAVPPPSAAPPPPSSAAPPPPVAASPSASPSSGCDSDGWCPSPYGPMQQCRDDAGPPWADDLETYGPNVRYHDNTPAEPILPADGACPGALAGACAAKGVKAAYLDGPIDCGGQGWFCRIMPQPGWGDCSYGDCNFANCATPDADELDTDGHCHGSDDDSTYGWWVRDHHFRGYTGTLNCCCG